jgi:hypothetical protein
MTVGEGSVRFGVRRSFAETVGVEGSGDGEKGGRNSGSRKDDDAARRRQR